MSSLLEQLIEAFRVLPGVGQKSAQRMAYHVLEREREGGRRLAAALANAVEKVGHCVQCRDFTESEVCAICANSGRDRQQLCVVESPADRLAIEHATGYRGVYFILQGVCRRWMVSARVSWGWTAWPSVWQRARSPK